MTTATRRSGDSSSAPPSASPVRVLVLADSPYAGGITSHIVTLAQAFRDSQDVAVRLATLPGRRQDCTLISRCCAERLPLHELPMRNRFDGGVVTRIYSLIREERIDIIHTHNYRATLLCAPLAGSVPTVNTCHGQAVEPGLRVRFYQHLELWAMRRHAATIACSMFVRDWLLRQGLAPHAVHVVPNASMDPMSPGAKPDKVRREDYSLPDDAVLLLYAGRLVEGKGLLELIRCVGSRPGLAAIIVGDGPLRAELEVAAAGLPVRLVGRREDPGPWYAAADIVVLPSQMEAMPMSLIEAAAWGKPAVATNVGGIPEVVDDGVTGALVGDASLLWQGIERLREPGVMRAMGAAARLRWEREFAPDHMKSQLEHIYKSITRNNLGP